MIEVKVDADGINNILKKTRAISPDGDMWYRALSEGGALMEEKLKQNVSGRLLKVRSGNLLRSLGYTVNRVNDGLEATIGSGVRGKARVTYADKLETGGVITAKGGKSLTIPTDYAKTPAGVARFTAPMVFNGQTQYKTGVILDDKIYGVIEQATRTKLVPLFLLRKSVTIPPKRWMSITAEENAHKVNELIFNALRRKLDGNA